VASQKLDGIGGEEVSTERRGQVKDKLDYERLIKVFMYEDYKRARLCSSNHSR